MKNFSGHNCSDIYIIVLLEATNLSEKVSRQQTEIQAADWLSIDEIFNSDIVHEHNKNFIREALRARYFCLLIISLFQLKTIKI